LIMNMENMGIEHYWESSKNYLKAVFAIFAT